MSYKATSCIYSCLTYTLLNWKSNIGILKINPIYCQNSLFCLFYISYLYNLGIENNINYPEVTHTSSTWRKNKSYVQQLSAGCLAGFLSGILAKHIGKFAIILFIGIYLVSWVFPNLLFHQLLMNT